MAAESRASIPASVRRAARRQLVERLRALQAEARDCPDGATKLRATASLTLIVGGCQTMRNRIVFEEGSVEAIARLREQDDEFCRRLRIAIEKGSEFCPTIVNTKPGTSRPIFNYKRP